MRTWDLPFGSDGYDSSMSGFESAELTFPGSHFAARYDLTPMCDAQPSVFIEPHSPR